MIRRLFAQSKRPLDNVFVEALVAGPLYLGGWVFVVGTVLLSTPLPHSGSGWITLSLRNRLLDLPSPSRCSC